MKDLNKLKGKAYKEAVKRIENYGSSDFEMRQAIQYRKNFMQMLKQNYQNYDNYRKLVRTLNKIENPLTFYEKLKNSTYGEKVIDIIFMYDTSDGEEILDSLIEEVGE